jgi:hypothetical protein
MTPEEYVELFQKGQKVKVKGLFGRVLHGFSNSNFESLSENSERRIVMMLGVDGLEKILGKSGYEILIELGYLPEIIKTQVELGIKFKLFLTPSFGGFKLANWDNVIEMVSIAYFYAGPRLRAVLPQLKKLEYSQIETLLGYSLGKVFKNGRGDSRFMTYNRYMKAEPTVGNARAFLYHSCFLYELFTGNGYTKLHGNGQRGIKEYVGRNCGLDVFSRHQLVDLNVVLP